MFNKINNQKNFSMKNANLFKHIILSGIICLFSFQANACDGTVVITTSNLIPIGGGQYTVDITFDNGGDEGENQTGPTFVYSGGDITAFSPTTLNGDNGNPAVGSLVGGDLIYSNGGSGDWKVGNVQSMVTLTILPTDGDPSFEEIILSESPTSP